MKNKQIYTIGHSTREIEEFIAILKENNIDLLVDIRRYPSSRKFPQFHSKELEESLKKEKIDYIWMEDLGGRRKVNKDSKNTKWRKETFRAYADYMETESFNKAMEKLEELAKENNVVYMCAEAVWWSCHRSLISDYLKAKNWKVIHLMGLNNSQEHPYTQPATIKNNKVYYNEIDN